MEYTVVRTESASSLAKEVNKLIKDGWKPLGGITVSPGGHYLQAMIKETSK
jgi:Domain of unknown function (DUF1737)